MKFWNFKAAENKTGRLYLYGDISTETWYGDEITPKTFQADLEALGDIDTLEVYVSSGGGEVFAGWAIINILRRHSARKIGYNDGVAASMAFDILMAMDEVVACENSMFMTHNCATLASGNKTELRQIADRMEEIDIMLAKNAAARSGKTPEEMEAIRAAETWYTPEEALAAGFIDRIDASFTAAASLDKKYLEKYKNIPPAVAISGAAEDPADVQGIIQPVADIDLTAQRMKLNAIRRKINGGI